ncbi:MAG: hypothetical protein ABR599_09225 [Gemmatimonadota bacterium]
MGVSRRVFLGAAAGTVAAGGLGLAVLERARVKGVALAHLTPMLEDVAPAPLAERTRAALGGFLETYLPPSAALPDAIGSTVAYADAEAQQTPGFGAALGAGLDSMGGEAGRALFAGGSPQARRRALEARFVPTGPVHYLGSGGRAYLRFRHWVLPSVVAEHFAGAAGWRVVGYQIFPGRCGAPRAYTQPPARV